MGDSPRPVLHAERVEDVARHRTSIVPYIALSVVMYFLLDVSYWLVLAVAIPASGFLLRTFILFHDCHARLAVRIAEGEQRVGSRPRARRHAPLQQLALAPRRPPWKRRRPRPPRPGRRADDDRRRVACGVADARSGLLALPPPRGDVHDRPAVVARDRTPHPAEERLEEAAPERPPDQPRAARHRRRHLRSHRADRLPPDPGADRLHGGSRPESGSSTSSISSRTSTGRTPMRGATRRRRSRAARISSLPQPLQFFTGNIGLHHVHHLNARIPNYNLQRAHDDNEIFHSVPVLTFMGRHQATRLKLWDEERRPPHHVRRGAADARRRAPAEIPSATLRS